MASTTSGRYFKLLNGSLITMIYLKKHSRGDYSKSYLITFVELFAKVSPEDLLFGVWNYLLNDMNSRWTSHLQNTCNFN
jgi:hypothetical protein